MRRSLHILLLLLLPLLHRAQESLLDSLKAAYASAKHDTLRCYLLNALIDNETDETKWEERADTLYSIADEGRKKSGPDLEPVFLRYMAYALNVQAYLYSGRGEYKKAEEYNFRLLSIGRRLRNPGAMSTALNNLGAIYFQNGDIKKALEYYEQSLKLSMSSGESWEVLSQLLNIGTIYESQGNMSKALEYYNKGLTIADKSGAKKYKAALLINIANLYQEQSDLAKGFEYLNQALDLFAELNDERGLSQCYNNIGNLEKRRGNYGRALDYYARSMQLSSKLNLTKSQASSNLNIGEVYAAKGELDKAMEYYRISERLFTYIGLKEGLTAARNRIARTHLQTGQYAEALRCATENMTHAKELGFPGEIRDCAQILKEVYLHAHDKKAALEMFELEIKMKDSLHNQGTRKAALRSQLKYEYERQAAADSVAHAKESEVKDAALKKQQAEIRSGRNQQYATFGGAILLLLFTGFMLNRFQVTRKQKELIEKQKALVETQKSLVELKQREVLDSIRYAQRIQRALMPTEKAVQMKLSRLNSRRS